MLIDKKSNMLRGVPQAALQMLLLLLLTVLVTVFYERGRTSDLALASLECWSVTSVVCLPNEANCINSSSSSSSSGNSNSCPFTSQLQSYYFYTHQGPTSMCNLVGQTPEYERGMQGTDYLFSTVGVPFLILCSQVITAAFFQGYVRYDSLDDSHSSTSNLQKTLKRISLLVQFTFAGNLFWLV